MAIYWYQHMHTTERIEDITWILVVEPAIQLHLVWIRERFCCFHPWRNMEVSMENKEVNCPNCLIVSRKKKESIESELHSRRQSEQFSSAHEVASLNKSFLSSLINLIKVMVTPPNQKWNDPHTEVITLEQVHKEYQTILIYLDSPETPTGRYIASFQLNFHSSWMQFLARHV